MSLLSDFRRVSRRNPCPVCDRPDWCLVSRDDFKNPSQVICARTESKQRWGDAGWLHTLRSNDGARWRKRRRYTVERRPAPPVLAELARQYQDDVDPARLDALVHSLGVSRESLERLGIGFAGWGWSFPMYDGSLRVCGIRIRKRNGRKLSLTNSREGLFVGCDGGVDELFVCEGPTDTAALMDLGFNAIGRPCARGGTSTTVVLVRRWQPRRVILMADNDGPGRSGAAAMARRLVPYVKEVCIVTPPTGVKDVREWKQLGATAADVRERTLKIEVGVCHA